MSTRSINECVACGSKWNCNEHICEHMGIYVISTIAINECARCSGICNGDAMAYCVAAGMAAGNAFCREGHVAAGMAAGNAFCREGNICLS